MSMVMSLVIVALFVALSPGVLVRLPPGGSKLTTAVVHGVIFVAVLYAIHMFMYSPMAVVVVSEGFAASKKAKGATCSKGPQCSSGKCTNQKCT
jgi:hypothetical protein